MRVLTTAIPLLLSSVVVLGHMHAPGHPARHHELANKRQQDDGTDGDVLGGLLGNSASNSTSVATSSTRSSTSSAITSSTSSRTTTSSSSAIISPSTTSSLISSSSLLPSVGVNTTRSSASVNTTESSTSASITSAPSSSAETSSAAASEALTTVTTDPGGEVKVITQIMTASASASSDAAAASSAAAKSSDSGISTGAIIGISVAAGVVVLSLVACAIWRMKRRGNDEDEAIRWPELNRHGDSDVHHALPARQTGHHGFETGLERSLSNSSDVFAPSTHSGPHSAAPMALNGSSFGAGSPIDAYEYDEKNAPALPPLPGHGDPHSAYEAEEDYANMPPAVQMQQAPSVHAYGGYDSEEEGRPPMPPHAHSQESQMGMVQGGAPATYYHHGH